MSKLAEICEELDEVLIEVMATLDELSSLRAKYTEAISEGYFYMSQARHAMGGPSTVSSLQYDARMRALVHIESTLETNASYDDLTKLASKELSVEFQVDRNDPKKIFKDKNTDTKQFEQSQLRKRKMNKDSVENVPTSKEPGETIVTTSHDQAKDPIKWFGVLVPPYLRRSQDHFKQVVLLVAELAGTQTKLEILRRKFRELLKKKNELVRKSPTEDSI